jgi:CO/xanthine dehydrogenase Mo-binding subunit
MSRLALKRDNALSAFSRRGFLIGMAGTSVLFGYLPARAAMDPGVPGGEPQALVSPVYEPAIWYSIDAKGIVTVNIIRAEMGQHVGTGIARMLADELEADWKDVRIVHVDTDPKWGMMVTGGSWSIWASYPIYSRAGAAGRIALIEAGAKLLDTTPDRCSAKDGTVTADGRSISYAEIVQRGGLSKQFTPEELEKLPIKPASERRLIGRPVADLDIACKVNGTGHYGIDAKVPGMVYARPKMPPTRYGSKVTSLDDSAARKIKGYIRSLIIDDPSETVPGWVMVIAESYPAAIRAADAVQVEWSAGAASKVSEKDLQARASALIDDPNAGVLLDTGDGDTASVFKTAHKTLEQTYTTASVMHYQLEPLNAICFEKDGLFEIHTGNQWQSLILPTLAKALGRDEKTIVMRTYLLGGGFGRRLNGDYIVPVALAAKALGKPVKMIMTRPDDALFDCFRSPSVQKLRMAFDDGGKVVGMEHDASAGWPTLAMAPAAMPKGKDGKPYDPFAISGADHWYEVGAQKVRAINNDLANASFRPGWLRSVGPGWTNWALESFMDEAAHRAGEDPLAFRLKLLTGAGRNAGKAPNSTGGAHRQAAVLKQVAEKAGWGEKLPADTGMGIATSFGQERDMPTWGACVAQVHVDRATGLIAVEKLTLVIDAGTIVDPDGARAQTEGALLWGLSMALYESSEFVNGRVKDTNLDTYEPLRIADIPRLDVTFVESGEVPVGLGEPPTTIIAPAIANAIFNAVGARLRHLPMKPEDVLKALNV